MRRSTTTRVAALALAALVALAAGGCGEEQEGQGALELSLAGGEAMRQGFPHDEGSVRHELVDGWTSLTFSRYVVSLGEVALTDPATGARVGGWDTLGVIDLKREADATRALVTLDGLPARRLDVAFSVRPPDASGTTQNLSADDADVQEMRANGWSILVEGEAVKGAQTLRFRVGLPVATRYARCTNGADNTQGIAVQADTTTSALIYPHAVHLFWDKLGTTNASMRFDAWAAVAAADAGGDPALITSAELDQQNLLDMRDADGDPLTTSGGSPLVYDNNGLFDDRLTLLRFVEVAARESVHFNGLGLCATTAL